MRYVKFLVAIAHLIPLFVDAQPNDGVQCSADPSYTVASLTTTSEYSFSTWLPDHHRQGESKGTEHTDSPDVPLTVTEEEFDQAVQLSGYPAPTAEQYRSFAQGVAKNSFYNKREVAMFLANIMHESMGLREKSEIRCRNTGCPGEYGSGPTGPFYYGRGYIQLTWKENYQRASLAIFGDQRLVDNPDQVATNEDVAWAVSFFYWSNNVHSQGGIQEGQFGVSIRAINGQLECNGSGHPGVQNRIRIYTNVLQAFHINEPVNEAGC
ncbi:hypothetical protein IWQ62_004933 [Dispira parvispora]|uniref:Glycoside hydrolase family 19 catalytic domain-containing protein n=1 Tax=Dispira parvispora TaxID=1520584 RepID=A0A9W8AKP4_9FUNG|nr:hypothetical protein IWQ62_004933 [Dispira parvispora]